MKMTWSENPMVCHICRKNHYTNRCTYREESVPNNKAEKVEDTPKKETAPTKALVNVTIRDDWGEDTDYGVLVLG